MKFARQYIENSDFFLVWRCGCRSVFTGVSEERCSFETSVNRPANSNAVPRPKIPESLKQTISLHSQQPMVVTPNQGPRRPSQPVIPLQGVYPTSHMPPISSSPSPHWVQSKCWLEQSVPRLIQALDFSRASIAFVLMSHHVCKQATKVNKLRNLYLIRVQPHQKRNRTT
jgi:hypothetical protein